MRYIDEVPTVAVRVPTFANIIAPMRFAKTTDTDFSKHVDRLPLRKQFYQRLTQKGFGKEEVEYASNCAAPIHHKAGEIRPETQGTSHWWKNLSDNPVVLFIGDVRSHPNDHHISPLPPPHPPPPPTAPH